MREDSHAGKYFPLFDSSYDCVLTTSMLRNYTEFRSCISDVVSHSASLWRCLRFFDLNAALGPPVLLSAVIHL